MKFKVNFEYTKAGTIEVEAESEQEAISIVENMEIGHQIDGEYLPDSFDAIIDEYDDNSYTHDTLPFQLLKKINKGQHEGEVSNEDVLKHVETYPNHSFGYHEHVDCVEIETWTHGGVNMFIVLLDDEGDYFSQLVKYVHEFDVDEEIELHRQGDRNRQDFTFKESVEDFEEYKDILADLLMFILLKSVRQSVITWLEVNRDNGFFDDEPEGKKESYKNITDQEVEFYFFDWMWSERD